LGCRIGCRGGGNAVGKGAEAGYGDGDFVSWGEVDGGFEADPNACGLSCCSHQYFGGVEGTWVDEQYLWRAHHLASVSALQTWS
jgi:hypothetical protein